MPTNTQGAAKVGLQLWVSKTYFTLVLLMYCIIFHTNNCNLCLSHPAFFHLWEQNVSSGIWIRPWRIKQRWNFPAAQCGAGRASALIHTHSFWAMSPPAGGLRRAHELAVAALPCLADLQKMPPPSGRCLKSCQSGGPGDTPFVCVRGSL